VLYRAYGKTVYFSHTSRMHFSVSLGLLKPMHAEMPKNATNHARNRPFPLRYVDFHLTHQCMGPPHSPRQTTARSLYALPHNDALVIMERRNFTPKLPLPLRRSPPKSNTPIASPTPLTTPNGIGIQSAVLPQYTCADRLMGMTIVLYQ